MDIFVTRSLVLTPEKQNQDLYSGLFYIKIVLIDNKYKKNNIIRLIGCIV